MGNGGAVVSTSPEIIRTCRELREYGWKERYISSIPGMNSRLDEIQAAILRLKLKRLEDNNQRRRVIAKAYTSAIRTPFITPPAEVAGTTHAMHLYVVECDERDHLERAFKKAAIGTARHYPAPVHLQPAYNGRLCCPGGMKATEHLYKRMISLPMYPELTETEIARICEVLSTI